jgi:hypothetical protein
VLTLLCTVAFGGPFLVAHLLADALLVTYLVLLVQANQAQQALVPQRRSAPLRSPALGRTEPAARRIAN